MAAPTGAVSSRWDQAVRAVARETGLSNVAADTWLNGVWLGMWLGDEVFADILAHQRFKGWLEANYADAPTLPRAFVLAVT